MTEGNGTENEAATSMGAAAAGSSNPGNGQQGTTAPATAAAAAAAAEGEEKPEPLTARMLNEFVYCPRLFYYEFVEKVFAHNADTLRGAHGHRRVDAGAGKMPPPGSVGNGQTPNSSRAERDGRSDPSAMHGGKSQTGEAAGTPGAEAELAAARGRGEVIHSRSVWLESARLGVNAKLDLVESREAGVPGGARTAVPVDYKKGAPREGEDGVTLWDADRMQLGLQMLVLRENGYDCAEGVIYYQETKQRVRLPWTGELAAWVERTVAGARACAASAVIPPPLEHSPKCPRCSLAPVCLPDETRLLAEATPPTAGSGEDDVAPTVARHPRPATPVRRLIAARDDRKPLYLNTPGLRVGVKSERLIVRNTERELDAVRLGDVSHLALFGNVQLSTQAVQTLCAMEVPITYFSMGGYFYGLTQGHGLKNVFTRVEQFRRAADPAGSLAIARAFVQGKVRNCRTLLMRNHVEVPDAPLRRLKQAVADVGRAGSRAELLGMEGAAAAVYFEHFAGMIKTERGATPAAPAAGVAGTTTTTAAAMSGDGSAPLRFDFNGRNRRPPRDPVNALLSLAYSLLAKDCTLAALAVGFDPYIGFYHQPRHGRPALALDLMEEFRPLVADSAVLTALNTRVLDVGDFLRAGDAVNLTQAGRGKFFEVYERRMNASLRHPVFDYQVSYRRALELQARLLARALTGEIGGYQPLLTR